MTIRHLINLTSRFRKPIYAFTLHQPLSTAATATDVSLPSPPPRTAMNFDQLDEADKKMLELSQCIPPHPTVVSRAEILSSSLTRITTLPNGLRIATESSLASKAATLGVFIDAGSRFDSEESSGSAHFLEHMLFEGTEKRNATELVEEIENMGSFMNASTFMEYTMYYAKVMNEDVPRALDIFSDILQNPRFDKKRIHRQRNVILQEMEEAEAEDVLFDYLYATAFQYTPLGRTILGPVENIKTIGRDQLQQYMSTHYTAPRMVVAASGAVKHDDIIEQVKKLFTKLSADPTTTSQLVAKKPAKFTGSEIRMLDDDIPLAQFMVAFEGASLTDPDSIVLKVMQSMLGTWNKNDGCEKHKSSELVQRVAINEIAESMTAFNCNYKDTGLFGVYAVAKPDCLDDLADAIMHEVTKLCYRVSEADVIRARDLSKASLLFHANGLSQCADTVKDIGLQVVTHGRRISYAELFARIDAVDASAIKHVANRFIFDRDIAIAAMGPIQGLPDYNWFRHRTSNCFPSLSHA